MKWSWKFGEAAGIDLRVHASFLILPGWAALSAWREGGSILAAVAFIVALMLCVVLHELGHALAARRFGIRTRDITLLPIGGVANLERIPENPRQELVVALAGPAVNVAIAGLLFLLPDAPFFNRLLVANLSLVLFNLIPAFPMDGGRVLRALLAMRMARVQATTIAARIGQAFAAVAFVAGMFGNPMLVPLAMFVWLAASDENEAVLMQTATLRTPVPCPHPAGVRLRVIQVIR